METENKFLDEQYLTTRIRDFKAIREGKLQFEIERSNNADSHSLYVKFYCNGVRRSILRVSDHSLSVSQTQFIIEPTRVLTKKKKEQFVKLVECSIRKALTRSLLNTLENIDKEN